MEEFMTRVHWLEIAVGMAGMLLFAHGCAAVDRWRSAGKPPSRRRYFAALVVAPDQVEAFCRDNRDMFTAEETYKLLQNDAVPLDPDLAVFGRQLARLQAERPGMAYVFRISPLPG